MVLLAHKSQEGKLEFFSTISRDLRERNALEDVLRSWARRLLEVQEAERRAVSLTLHDEIGQQLTGVSMKLESTRGATREHVDLRIGEALRQLKDLMVTVGALSASLVPSILLDLGLLSALNSLILQHRQNGAMDIDLQHSGLDRRFLPEIETAAYRIVQESLTNVIRHASASEARVAVVANDHKIAISVDDNGVGFDAEAQASLISVGLMGMRERAESQGGQFNIESSLGQGTTIRVDLPLDKVD